MFCRLLAVAGLATSLPALAAAQGDAGRMAALEQRIADLESRLASSGTGMSGQSGQSGPDFTFGSEIQSSVEFYGYLKADFIYDFDYELGNTTFPLAYLGSSDPDVAVRDDSAFNATGQQLRLGFRTTTPTNLGDLGTRVEIDFYGGDGAFGTEDPYEPRVRHAYIDLAGFRIGKNWTTFMPLSSYPLTLDFQGVLGIPFARQEMIRYTHEFGGSFVAEVALEESNGDSDSPVGIAALAYDTDPLLLRASGIVGKVNADDGEEDIYGVNLSTTVSLWEGATFDAAYTFGEGISSYLVFLGGDVTPDGDVVETRSAYAAISQSVGERLTLRGMYGWRMNDDPSTSAAYEFEKLTGLHLNAEYEIVDNTQIGIEYFRGTNDNFDGDEFDTDRLQASVTYNF